jgi:hypothetical protein
MKMWAAVVLPQDSFQWKVIVNTVMKFSDSIHAEQLILFREDTGQ